MVVEFCKELLFNCSYDHIQKRYTKDSFNYSTGLVKNDSNIKSVLLFMNGQDRLKITDFNYYDKLQPYLYHTHGTSIGTGCYTFNIIPEGHQPAGHCNFRKIKDAELRFIMDKGVSHTRPMNLRVYSRSIDLMTIQYGLCEIYNSD